MTGNPIFWVLAAAVLACAVWLAMSMRVDRNRRRARWLAVLRVSAAMLFALVLLQPQCRRREVVVERPLVGVLIDTSQSMQDNERGRAAMAWLDSPEFRKARESCELKVFSIGAGLAEAVPGEISFNGKASAINAGLDEWTRRHGKGLAAGVVLISDGLDTGGGPPLAMDLPCWVMEVEAPRAMPARIAIWQVEPPQRPMAGAESSVRVVTQAWGTGDNEIPVELWSDGRKLGEKRVRFVNSGDVAEAILPLKPERPGTYPYEIRVADPAADASARSQPFVIHVRQTGEGILLLSNSLGFEGKFLRRALTTNRNLRLDSYARWQDGRWASIGEGNDKSKDTLDLSAAGLASRVAVVLADVSPDALNPAQWQAIREFTSNGGGLIVLGGPNLLASPQAAAVLGTLLPVPTPAPHRDGRFGVKLTDAGLRHPVFGPLFESVREFPALQGANLSSGVAGNAQVLMESIADGQAHPLVVVKQQGKGRVAVVLSDTLWRWRVAAPGWTGRLSAYDTFWSQMIDWLAPAQDGLQANGRIELTTGRSFYRQGDEVVIQAEWLGRGDAPFATIDATVKGPDGKETAVKLVASVWQNPDGRRVNGFRGALTVDATGVYDAGVRVAWQGGEAAANTRIAVAASPAERRGEAPDAAFLQTIARQSGGAYFTRANAGKWLDALPKPRRQSEHEVITDGWNHPSIVILLLACLCAEWWVRRRNGLA